MKRLSRVLAGCVVALGVVFGIGSAAAQTAAPAAHNCVPDRNPPSDAEKALLDRRFDEAEAGFNAALKSGGAASSRAMAGLVRVKLAEGKLAEALSLATGFAKDHPDDVILLDALGEVRFRRGEVNLAAALYQRALKLDPCYARLHYDVGRWQNLDGRYATAQKQLDVAHQLAPADPVITRAWENTQRVPPTPEQRISNLQNRLEHADNLSDEQKTALQNTLKALQTRQKGDCELAAPIETARVPMWATNGTTNGAEHPTRSSVDVFLNGKRRRFLVDTGASGMLLSKDAAKSLGLTPEAESKSFGIGDSGLQSEFVSHVDNVKIGDMEFHNCMVRVLQTDTMKWVDGLLGPDMFRSFVVTLDFPGNELRLSPLPRRPDQPDAKPTLATEGDAAPSASGLTIAQTRTDRYIAPEMKDWTPVFRSGHDLIVPALIGNVPEKLFILDSGAGSNLISIEAAREVTHVSQGAGGELRGISGRVEHVAGTDSLFIQFARLRQQIPYGLSAIDMSGMSRSVGVDISGFIGYPILSQLVLQIDYRDNLINATYKPHVQR